MREKDRRKGGSGAFIAIIASTHPLIGMPGKVINKNRAGGVGAWCTKALLVYSSRLPTK